MSEAEERKGFEEWFTAYSGENPAESIKSELLDAWLARAQMPLPPAIEDVAKTINDNCYYLAWQIDGALSEAQKDKLRTITKALQAAEDKLRALLGNEGL